VNDRIKDVVFDWNRMLAFDGSTAPSMYAYSCICSILRKLVDCGEERALVIGLIQFPDAVRRSAEQERCARHAPAYQP
jgi:arginyl-tRNA synthetase